jgi:hypothetical protein
MRSILQRAMVAATAVALLTVAGCGAKSEDKLSSVSEKLNGVTSTQVWNPGAGQLKITVQTGKLEPGWCYAGLFDWKINRLGTDDHHDPRMFVVCKPGVTREQTFQDDPKNGLVGMNKAGMCYGPREDVTNSAGRCQMGKGSQSLKNFSAKLPKRVGAKKSPNPCLLAVIIESDGSVTTNDGGNPTDCDN